MKVVDLVEAYIAYRRSLGEKYQSPAVMLHSFARFVGENRDSMSIDEETCTAFLYSPNNEVSASWFLRYSSLKWMFEWAIVRGHMQEVVLPKEKPKALEHGKPYIYSMEELGRIFDSALTYQKHKSKTPPKCVQTILKLTYVLGLRISETVSLHVKDLNLHERYVLIRQTKFYKTRMVPFNEQVSLLLTAFLDWREAQGWPSDDDAYVFLDKDKKGLGVDVVRNAFHRIRDMAGIKRTDGACHQPRLHDLRHTFAVHRLTEWYRSGKDVNKLLSSLSTYLGHDHLSNTSVYLSMTDELLDEANNLFNKYRNGKVET